MKIFHFPQQNGSFMMTWVLILSYILSYILRAAERSSSWILIVKKQKSLGAVQVWRQHILSLFGLISRNWSTCLNYFEQSMPAAVHCHTTNPLTNSWLFTALHWFSQCSAVQSSELFGVEGVVMFCHRHMLCSEQLRKAV